MGTDRVSRPLELNELSGFPLPVRAAGHRRPPIETLMGHCGQRQNFPPAPRTDRGLARPLQRNLSPAPQMRPRASSHDRCCLQGCLRRDSRLAGLDGPLINSRAATATGGAVRLLAAAGRGDPNPRASPKAVPLPTSHHTALNRPGNLCLPCLYHVFSVVIARVEHRDLCGRTRVSKRSGRLPATVPRPAPTQAQGGHQIANSPPDLLWHHAGPQATPGIWPKQTICC